MKKKEEPKSEKAKAEKSTRVENESKANRSRSFRNLIDGSLLTSKAVVRQLPFMVFLFVLAIFYIGNRYHAIRILKETMALQNELKELRADAISTASELMFMSRQSQVARMVKDEGLELQESLVPPKVIKP